MSKPNMIDVEAWVIIDADGNYEIAKDKDAVTEAYQENVGDFDATPLRVIRVTLKVPAPKVVELTAEIGDEAVVGELVTTG